MATLPLRNVPFDIWENVFDKLDHATLCALCLVSHDVYEVASPILYRTMIWRPISRSPWTNVYKDEALHRTGIEGEPTIAAFLRRPSLRTHVRIIIFTRGKRINCTMARCSFFIARQYSHDLDFCREIL